MMLYLHNLANQAHLEDLEDRLRGELACGRFGSGLVARDDRLIAVLLSIVRAMDQGAITTEVVQAEFTRRGFPSFSRWLADMVDEGVYLDLQLNKAA